MNRPSKPSEAFPEGRFDRWREFVLDVDPGPVFAAAVAEKLAAAIAARRAATGESMRDLAAAINVSRAVLTNMAGCRTYPMSDTIRRLESAFGVPVDPTHEVQVVERAALQAALARSRAERDEAVAERDAALALLATRGAPPDRNQGRPSLNESLSAIGVERDVSSHEQAC